MWSPAWGLLAIAVLSAGAAGAEPLYQLSGGGIGTVVSTGNTDVWAGFSFSVASGYKASIDKIGIWVKDSTVVSTNTVNMYQRTAGGAWSDSSFVSQSLTGCTITGNFCELNVSGTSLNLSGGKEYMIVARYKNTGPSSNTDYLQNVTDSNIAFAANTSFVDNYSFSFFPSSGSATPGVNKGFFGPSLGLNVTPDGPTPPVPAPLPLVGASAAFSWSRRLRKRVKVSGC